VRDIKINEVLGQHRSSLVMIRRLIISLNTMLPLKRFCMYLDTVKKIVTRLKDENYAIIGEYYGRCLVLIVTRKEADQFILRTART